MPSECPEQLGHIDKCEECSRLLDTCDGNEEYWEREKEKVMNLEKEKLEELNQKILDLEKRHTREKFALIDGQRILDSELIVLLG